VAETSLHAALKAWYAQPEDQVEARIDGYIIDVVHGETLIEIQTRSFTAIKAKLLDLVPRHRVHLVYPIAREKWIVKVARDREKVLGRRKSPKRGRPVQVFEELVSFPGLIAEPSFSLELLLTQEEEVRHHDPRRGWRRRGWMTHERRLLGVVERRRYETPSDLAALLPPSLAAADAPPFTTADLARALKERRRLAQRMAYCLREMGVLVPVGKRGNAILYAPACT
jgi:hypothetical protein